MTSSSPPPSPKLITLQTCDNEIFEIKETVIGMSKTIKEIIEEYDGATIPLQNVTGKTMAKVVEYCKKHEEDESRKRENDDYSSNYDSTMITWDKEFVEGFINDQEVLFDVVMAANYLEIKGLLDLTCKSIAELIKGKTPEQVRKTFHIKNDFTEEEENEIRRENSWAFED